MPHSVLHCMVQWWNVCMWAYCFGCCFYCSWEHLFLSSFYLWPTLDICIVLRHLVFVYRMRNLHAIIHWLCSPRSVSERRWRRLHHITDSHLVWFILHIYCIHQDNMAYLVIDPLNINNISLKISLHISIIIPNFGPFFYSYRPFLSTDLPSYIHSFTGHHPHTWLASTIMKCHIGSKPAGHFTMPKIFAK